MRKEKTAHSLIFEIWFKISVLQNRKDEFYKPSSAVHIFEQQKQDDRITPW